MQELLENFFEEKLPSKVDSCAIAGLLDLHRAQGVWVSAVRFGYLYGALASAGNLLRQFWAGDMGGLRRV